MTGPNALDVCQQVWVLGCRHCARSPAELSSGWCGRIESRPIDMRVDVLTSYRRWPRRNGSRGSGAERRPHPPNNWSFYRRRRALDELPKFSQTEQDGLRVDSQFGGEFVHSHLRHLLSTHGHPARCVFQAAKHHRRSRVARSVCCMLQTPAAMTRLNRPVAVRHPTEAAASRAARSGVSRPGSRRATGSDRSGKP